MFQEFEENDKSEEFLSDFRNKINQQSIASFQEKKEEVARSKNILIGALSGIILAGVVGFVAFSPKYADNKSKELPVIRRPQTAVKVQPLEPGGMEIANKDKSIYDIIEKKVEDTNQNVESILPPPEEIKAPVVAEAAPSVSVDEIIKEAETAPKEVASAATKKVAPAASEEVVAAAPKEVAKVAIPAPVKVEQPKAEKIVAPKVVAAAKPAPKTVAKKPAVAKGMWQVQIMSSQNKSAIEKSKASIAKKYAALKGVDIMIEDAYIAGKGTFYRLKAGAYSSKSQADKLCAELKKAGLGCFVKQK